MTQKLILFDIDGTLLDTGGAGGAALLDAAEEILNVRRDDLPPLDLAGATDAGVIKKLFSDAGHPLETNRVQAFREAYLDRLRHRLHEEVFVGRLLDGVEQLLTELQARPHFAVGLLTGNLRHGADLKLQRFRIDHHFLDGGFGDDAEHRNDIGPFALRRMNAACGKTFSPHQVIVIGDTPKDIACAEAMGARCLAVATGRFDHRSLSAHESATVLEDLSHTGHVLDLLAA